MGYYCTVPQCTSLAGKTKNVKFHRFPRDVNMADKWNNILKRGKPYTKYSKVCSLHFTQGDYNVTTMGQWKTLSKEAVPTQNLPILNPDGSVMVIRKSRTLKYKDGPKRDHEHLGDKEREKWSNMSMNTSTDVSMHNDSLQTTTLPYRLHNTNQQSKENCIQNEPVLVLKPGKQDAIMQTDPLSEEEDQLLTNYSENSENSYNSEPITQTYHNQLVDNQNQYSNNLENQLVANREYESSKEYIKNEEEKYCLDEECYEKNSYPILKISEVYSNGYRQETFVENHYDNNVRNQYDSYNNYPEAIDILRNQQHNLGILQTQRVQDQKFYEGSQIKQEIDLSNEEDYLYERSKDSESHQENMYESNRERLFDQIQHVKMEPPGHVIACDAVMQNQDNSFYQNEMYYDNLSRQPGPEMLIAKQNALAAHTQLWQNTMKRPFFYSENQHYTGAPLHKYEDMSRIIQ